LQKNPKGWDLLLTDQTMPKMTGDLLAVKARELNPTLPVILCSGFSETLDEKRARSLGVTAYLQKPTTSTALLNSVAKALSP
jgi:CheY-like chemotaxis protein